MRTFHKLLTLAAVTIIISLVCIAAVMTDLRHVSRLTDTIDNLSLTSDHVLAQTVILNRLVTARQRELHEAEKDAALKYDENAAATDELLAALTANPDALALSRQHELQSAWQKLRLVQADVIAGRDARRNLEIADANAFALANDARQLRQLAAEKLARTMTRCKITAGLWLAATTASILLLGLFFWRDIAARIRDLNRQIALYPIGGQPSVVIPSHDDLAGLEATLRRFLTQADQASRAKDNFFAVMSHEIRTPLNGVIGFLANLRETPLNPQQKQYVRIIEASSRSLMHVINEVLDYSKINAGSLELEELAFDCLALAEDRIAMTKQLAKPKGLKVVLDTNLVEPLIIRGDPTRLRQILDNLLGNAVKFTEHGEIRLQIAVTDDDQGAVHIAFTVSDTGIGIPHNVQEHLLKPYVQGSASVARQFGGAGLGLSIVDSLVKMMGGKLTMTSRVGEGTRFAFAIKTVKAKPEEQVRLSGHFRVNLPRQELKKYLALLVDDTPTNLFLLETICQGAGLPYRTAQNGLEALNLCRQQRFDLIFMDIQMPVMDGYTAIREIRQLPNSGTTQIIALTASAFQEDVEKALGAGSTGFIPKPFERDQLLLSIADALGITPQRELRETCDLIETREEAIARRMHDFMREQYHISIGEIKMVLAQTVADWRPLLDNLAVYAQKNNWEDARAILHRLKGQLSSIGLTEMSQNTAEIMDMHDRSEEVIPAINELIQNLTKIFTVLEQDITIV